jgi:tetratricopeptide (TPR) repeat protein
MRLLLALALVAWAQTAQAADKLRYGPAPAWVKTVSTPASSPGSGALQVLLSDSQVRYTAAGDEMYSRSVYSPRTADALVGAGTATLTWNPETETVTVHRLAIRREGENIDVLKTGRRFLELRRERGLEAAMLDGRLTATLQIEGLRVSDVIEFAYTRLHRDPLLLGRSEDSLSLLGASTVRRRYIRRLWSGDKPIRWRTGPAVEGFVESRTSDGVELLFDSTDMKPTRTPEGAPARFRHIGDVELTQFVDWAEVSALFAPLFTRASALEAKSPLRAEVERIRSANPEPKARAAEALRLVQSEVRYVFLGMNQGGLVPASADETWRRRFADCKGKTALLLALLRELGIEAEAVLVSSYDSDGLDERLPRVGAFDHVLVRATVDGKIYWLDGTRRGDQSLDLLSPPAFRWALPVAVRDAVLAAIDRPVPAKPSMEQILTIDLSAGLDAPAKVRQETIARGDGALLVRALLEFGEDAQSERSMQAAWRAQYPWAPTATVRFSFDEATGEARTIYEATGAPEWRRFGAFQEWPLAESVVGWNAAFTRTPGPGSDAPFSVGNPSHTSRKVVMVLPDGGIGFTYYGNDIDQTLGPYVIRRQTRMEKGVLTMTNVSLTTAPEMTAAEAERIAPVIRALRSQIVVRGPAVGEISTPASGAASTAAEYTQRGIGALMDGRYDAAIADLTRATELEPTSAKHLYNRGVARFEKKAYAEAAADFSAALTLDAKHVLARQARGEAQLALGKDPEAQADFAEAARRSPDDASLRVRTAEAYAKAGQLERAVRLFDQGLAQKPAAKFEDRLLAGRCAAIARWGRELERGLADCNRRLQHGSDLATVEGRALVRLRLGQIDGALADFDMALRSKPQSGAALYGRGLARLRKGLTTEGELDLAEAAKAEPKIADTFSGYGLRP